MSFEDRQWSNVDMALSRSERHSKSGKKYHGYRMYKRNDYENSEGRIVNSREYAIAWGVKNRPYSASMLFKMCKHPDAPSYRYIMHKEWNGWRDYYKTLVKAGMIPKPPRSDAERRKYLGKISHDGFKNALLPKDYEIAKFAVLCGIKTRSSYYEYRINNPESKQFLPCLSTIEYKFGSWKRFKYEMKKYDADLTINEYVKKSYDSGHWLTLDECDRLLIPIRGIMDVLRPSVFNSLCYRKLDILGLDKNTVKKNKRKKTES